MDIRASQPDRQLRKVRANASFHQWSVEMDIDWSRPVQRPGWLKRKFHASLISQFKYGELVTIEICKKLKHSIREPLILDLLDQQIADEARHAAAYDIYLQKLGNETPQDPAMAHLQSALLGWNGSNVGLIVAVHILLEGEALRTLHDIADDFPCPLFAELNRRITQDEARHVAFGNLYLKQRLPKLCADERREIFRFIRSLWEETTCQIFDSFYVPGFVTRHLRTRWVEQGWHHHCKTMEDVGLIPFDAARRI